tara:strand:+ start:248 stop:925 length:678 start_codon:yes stop_codon:yes gene_type:complete
MSDNNYSRMPDVGSDEPEVEDKHDDLIFKEPTQIETSHEPKVSESVDEKKERLKEHLARCRVKSAEVRAAKKAEKQANKKPRGRPKKLKEPVAPTEEVVLDIKEMNEPLLKEEPKQNSQQIDYEKLTNMLAAKMRPLTPTPTPTAKVTPPPPQQKLVNNQEQLGNFLTQFGNVVRQQEQKKMAEAAVIKKKNDLHKNTKKYYGKLPPTNFFEPTTDWDALFNARS